MNNGYESHNGSNKNYYNHFVQPTLESEEKPAIQSHPINYRLYKSYSNMYVNPVTLLLVNRHNAPPFIDAHDHQG